MFRNAKTEPKRHGLGGVWAAAVTPHRREGWEADFAGMLELVDRLSHSGVDGIVLLGATGEFLNLKRDDRQRLVHLAVKRSRVPIMAGVSHSTLESATKLSSAAVDSGVVGLLLMPPYFYRYDDAEILAFYRTFAETVGDALPVLLYNIPRFTNPISLNVARDLLSEGSYAGIKDSSGDLAFLESLSTLRRENPFELFCGDDRLLLDAVRLGCDGVISGVACAVPELILALYHATDDTLIAELRGHLLEFITWIERFPVPVGISAATEARGAKVGPPAIPLTAAQAVALEQFKDWFANWLPVIRKLPHARPAT
jgi:dihydrodipicolinate synthase/N-acetylneuraminate lyase